MKLIKSVLLVLMTFMSLIANAYDIKIDKIYYNLHENEATVTYQSTEFASYEDDVIIPNTITYKGKSYSVTRIGESAFKNCSLLTSVSIPQSVKMIEKAAFHNCGTWLKSVEFPNGVESIGAAAFAFCTGLTEVEIPISVEEIGTGAFGGCTQLKKVIINSNSIVNKTFVDKATYVSDVSGLKDIFGTQVKIYVLGNKITEIADYAFRDCANLTSVELPSSLQSIGNHSFSGCSALRSVSFPNSLTTIGFCAFRGCNKLTTITIPKGVENIGVGAFSCDNLNSVTINSNHITSAEYGSPNGGGTLITLCNIFGEQVKEYTLGTDVLSIGSEAFEFCTNLQSITMSDNLTKIGDNAFFHCGKLASIYLSANITEIGNSAFSSCESLISIELSNKLERIGKQAFYGCKSLKEITIPSLLNDIPDGLFAGCTGLSYVKVPSNIKSIGNSSFKGCTGLVRIDLTGSLSAIDNLAFAECFNITDIYSLTDDIPNIEENTFEESSYNLATLYVPANQLNSYKKQSTPWHRFNKLQGIGSAFFTLTYVIDNDVYKSYEVEEGTVITPEPDPVKEGYTFSGWSEIPQTMPSMDLLITGSFSVNTYTLSYVVDGEIYKKYEYKFGDNIIPEEFPIKDGYTFSGWSEIPETMPSHDVTVIGTFVAVPENINFADPNVKAICVANWDVNNDDELSKEEAASVESLSYVFSGNQNIVSFNELQYFVGISEIETGCFMNCINLNSITIPVGVKRIKDLAFEYCTSLTQVNIIDLKAWCQISFDKESSNPLYYAHNLYLDGQLLSELNIPDGINSILPYAFSGCTNIATLNMGTGVVEIGNGAFHNCTSIMALEIPDNITTIGAKAFLGCSGITSLKISNSVRTINNSTFSGCSSLVNVELPESLVSIDRTAFSMCSSLTSIVIPIGVTSIGMGAFNSCSNLTNIELPYSITRIEERAFWGCNSIEQINSFIDNPFPINTNVFSNYETPVLKVPTGTVEKYKNTDTWKMFKNISDETTTFIKGIKTNDAEPSQIYTLDGLRTSTYTDGINIIRKNNGRVQKVIIK